MRFITRGPTPVAYPVFCFQTISNIDSTVSYHISQKYINSSLLLNQGSKILYIIRALSLGLMSGGTTQTERAFPRWRTIEVSIHTKLSVQDITDIQSSHPDWSFTSSRLRLLSSTPFHHFAMSATQRAKSLSQSPEPPSTRSSNCSSPPKKTNSSSKDAEWSQVTDPEERRRIQNRIAQRKFRTFLPCPNASHFLSGLVPC